MEESQFDRQVFVAQRGTPRRPGSSILGPLLFLGFVALVGFGAYRFLNGNSLAMIGGGEKTEFAQISHRLEEIEKRIEQLEKRRKVSSTESTPSLPASQAGPKKWVGPVASASSPIPPVSGPTTPVATGAKPGSDSHLSNLQQEFNSVRSDLAATRQAWEATAERLGRTVGELGEQRADINRTRESLEQVLGVLDRARLPFQLNKKMGRQRVGPVWLQLRSTDAKRQLYTIGVFFDDNKWVEVKDRALREPVEFSSAGASVPLQLVVSEIHNDQVLGYLAVPKQEKQPKK